MKHIFFASLACGVMSVSFGAADVSAQSAASPSSSLDSSTPSISAEAFMHRAAISDLFEIQSSQLAQRQSSSPAVKAFAARMIQDHTDSTSKLLDAVKEARMETSVPAILDSQHRAMISQLKKLSGAEFDQQYMSMQIAAHNDALNLLQDYTATGTSAGLKKFAVAIEPTVQDHLAMAQKIVKGGYKS